MIQLVASTRRFVAGVAAFALLAGLVPTRSSAHSDAGPLRLCAAADSTAPPTPPVPTPVAPDSTATPAPPVPATPAAPAPESGKKAKKTKAPKLTKQEKAALAKSGKADKAKAPKLTKEEKAAQAKAEKEAKAKARAEKSAKSKAGKTAEPKTEKAAAESKETPAKATKPPKPGKPPKPPEKSFEEQQKEDGIYAKHSNWLTLRFGYAKRTGDLTGDGFVGYGVGYQHMITKKYAFAANVGHDVVGHFQNQLDEAFPFTGEFQRHFKWDTALRPFVGLGGGYYLRKSYRTGNDYNTAATGGAHLSLGFTSALDLHHVVGVEARVARLTGRPGVVNPTFGPGTDSETIWTVKLIWGLVY